MNKIKSALPVGDLGQYATALVIVGIMIGLGTIILWQVDDTNAVSPITYANESVALVNSTYTALTYPRGLEITAITNATAGAGDPTYTNFTLLTNRTGTAIYPDPAQGEGWTGTYYVQYTYSADSDASDALINASDGLGVFGDWLVIIAIVIVAVVVLTLIKYL